MFQTSSASYQRSSHADPLPASGPGAWGCLKTRSVLLNPGAPVVQQKVSISLIKREKKKQNYAPPQAYHLLASLIPKDQFIVYLPPVNMRLVKSEPSFHQALRARASIQLGPPRPRRSSSPRFCFQNKWAGSPRVPLMISASALPLAPAKRAAAWQPQPSVAHRFGVTPPHPRSDAS